MSLGRELHDLCYDSHCRWRSRCATGDSQRHQNERHPKNIPYCIGWVQRVFSKYPGRSEDELGRTEIEGFLSEISTQLGIGNWQVQQARNALELYYEKFRGIALSPRNCLPTDDFAVSVHSTHEPVLKTRPPNALTQKDNPTTKAVYTRPFGDVNTKVVLPGFACE